MTTLTPIALRPHPALAGPMLMLAAALLFTGLNILIKIAGPEFRIWDIAFCRFFGGLVILVSFMGRYGNPFKGNDIRLLVIRGCTGSAAFLCMLTAIRLLPVSTALVLFFSFPAHAAIFSRIIYGERIGTSGLVSVAAVAAGVAVLFEVHLAGPAIGYVFGVLGGAFAGLTVTLIKALRAKNGPGIIYLYFCAMGLLVVFPGFIAAPVLPDTGPEWLIWGGIVATSTTAQLLMNQGFFYCKSWEGGVFMSSEVVFTALVGIVLLGEPMTLRFLLGSLLVVGSAVILHATRTPAPETIQTET